MHGPGERSATNALGWEPIYPDPIPVIDTFVTSLGPLRRAIWRRARGEGLAFWERAGLRFAVTEKRAKDYAPYAVFDDTIPPPFYCPSGAIRLVEITVPGPYTGPTGQEFGGTGFASWQDHKYEPTTGMELPGGGAAFYRNYAVFWRSFWFGSLRALIAHEVGHCLGQWHKQGGVMGGGTRPDAHELDSLTAYYQGV